jgi:hypothetical protein
MFYECCILYVLVIDKRENEWKSYGNNIYLFGLNKLKWLDAKVSKIVINKNPLKDVDSRVFTRMLHGKKIPSDLDL